MVESRSQEVRPGDKVRRATDAEDCKVFQTDRFFRSNGMWYFATREGVDFGPFTIRPDSEKALDRYIDTQQTMQRVCRRDPNIGEENQRDEQSVAGAAKTISAWRLDRAGRPSGSYSDRSDKHN
jgi:hypothetical protein